MITRLKYLGSIGTWSLKKKIGGGCMFLRIIIIFKIKTIASISMYSTDRTQPNTKADPKSGPEI